MDEIILEVQLPVPVKTLAVVVDALVKLPGCEKLFMRQVGERLQIYKPAVPQPVEVTT